MYLLSVVLYFHHKMILFFSIRFPTCLQCSTYELPQPKLFFYSLTRIISFRNPSTDPHHPNDIRVEYQIDSVAELDLYTQDILKNINMYVNDGFKMIIVYDTYYGTTTFKQYKKSSKVPKKPVFSHGRRTRWPLKLLWNSLILIIFCSF